jgi:hypothetical protein
MAIPQMAKKKVEMVETEMGRMVPKKQQEKWEESMGRDLDKAVPTPYKMAMAAKEEENKVKAVRKALFKRGKEAVATPSGRKITAVMIKTK